MTEIDLSEKQELGMEILNDPTVVDILWGGGAGSGKTFMVCLWMVIQCRNKKGIRIGLGRKELKRLKDTTVFTLLNEVHPLLGINDHEFVYREQQGVIRYLNGSTIHLVDLARMPSDPDYDRFGSLNFTHVVIEEGGEIVKKARDIIISRKNRYLNKKYGIVGKSITTCNPSQNYLKAEYYKPYKELGNGSYQKWKYGEVEIEGKTKTAYRAFIQSLAKDNPFLPQNYINVLRQLPNAERKRLLEGNWDFSEDDSMLFPSRIIDRVVVSKLETGNRFIGVDIGDTGSDPTIMSLIEENILVDQKQVVVNKDESIGDQIALEVVKYAQQNNVDPKNIGIDAIGVGASCRDFLRKRGWRVREFIAGSSSSDNFRNIRGEAIYNLSQAMDKEEFKIYSGITTLGLLREELMAHEYTTEERVILIKSKKDIKEVLGRSPDHAESLYIAHWVSKANNDPRFNTNRVSY